MKKLLSLMMLMLLCTSAWAETVTDELTPTTLSLSGSGYVRWTKTFPSGAVYAGITCPNKNYIQLKSGDNSGIVTTTSGGKVKFVQFAFDSSTTGGRVVEIYGKNEAYTSTDDLYDSSKQGTKLGEYAKSNTNDITLTVPDEYKYIGIRSNNGALYLSKIDITWEKVTPPAVETPVITFDPAAPYQGDNVTCTISCATDGAAIQYSTDDENYSDYPDGGFTLTENTTVYAQAKLGKDVSEVASKSIEFKPTVQTVGAFPTEANTDFKFNGEAIVTYNNGKYCYIKDNTSSALLFDDSFTNSGSLVGKKITGFKGIMTLYNGLHEVININDLAYADDDPVTVTPTERTITEIMTGNLQNEFAVLRGVSISSVSNTTSAQNFTITDGEKTLTGRTNFYSNVTFPSSVEHKTFDIEGFVGIFNETIQFYPTKFTENVSEDFEVSITPDGGDYTAPVTVTIETVNGVGDVLISYTLDGTDPYESNTAITYEAPFTLTSSCTVKAYAYYEVENVTTKARAEKTYTINLPPLEFTMTPPPGTYQGEREVTISSNAVSDFESLNWEYAPEDDSTPIEGDETNMTFIAAKTGVLTIIATEANTGRTYETPGGGFVYTITEPISLDGMIVFKDNLNDSGQPVDSNSGLTDAKGQIEKGSDYVKDAIVEGKIYPGASGLKFGSSGEGGKMTLNLKNTWNATKISFIAKRFNNDETKLTVNGNVFTPGNDFTLYEFVPENPVKAITFVTSGKNQRAYLKVINIEGEEIILEKTATPEISVTEGEESYTVTATGAGEVKLYQDNVEVGNPCVVDRTSEEQTFVFTATAQEEGKDISEVATQNVTVPALPVVEPFGITVTPEAGTYTEPVLVTITATGLEEGQTATITYRLNGGDEQTYTEPFTLSETTAVSVRATFGDKVATWTGTYTINLPIENPTGLIVFKSNNSDSSSALDGEGLIDEIDGDGKDYVLSADNIVNVYAGQNGLKFGTRSENGSMTLNLRGTWNANKISIIAKNYDDNAKFKVTVNGNSKEFNLSNDKAFRLYEFQLEQAQEVSAITFESTNRAYLKVINIEGQAPVIYRITVDNEGGDYKGRADVKAALEPELEGATLTYTFAEDGATETPAEQAYPEAGVTVLKSGKLTFIARNGETELARWEGNYTITPLIGDVNGDGKVDVGDVNYVISIILGKINPNE